MTIAVACGCGKRFQAKDELAGRRVKCPNCGGVIAIPNVEKPLVDPSANPFSDNKEPTSSADMGHSPPMSPVTQTPLAKPATPAKKSKTGLIIGLCVGGGVLALFMVVFIAGVVWLMNSGRGDGDAIVAANAVVEATPPNTPSPSAAPVTSGKPLTDDECLAAATKYAQAITDGDANAAKGLVDFNEVLRRATANVEVTEDVRRGFASGFLGSTGNGGYERQLTGLLEGGGRCDALRVHQVGNETRVWMRLTSDSQGLVYQDLIFFRGADKQPHVADMYVVAAGELLSQTIRRMYIPLAASNDKNLLERLTGAESDFVKHASDLQQMMAQMQNQPAAALASYRRLPESLRKNKAIMLIRVQAAASADEREYLTAMEEFQKEFPEDAAVEMQSIDWHLLREEYDEAIASVDAVDQIVGGDPFLHTMRANILTEKGDFTAAEQAANKAIEADATMTDAYWVLVNVAIRKGDFAATLGSLKRLDQAFEMEWGDLSEISDYAEFVQSPQFQEWNAYLDSK
jgi:tetratricopeptide (TPR) repeat protein